MSDLSQIVSAVEKHKKGNAPRIDYGTAGFRTCADLLDHVVFRMGILAGLRSVQKKAAIGLMITASHNPECDNGVKIVDPSGEMLETSWEDLATEVGNIDDDKLPELLKKISLDEGIDLDRLSNLPPQNDVDKVEENVEEEAKDEAEEKAESVKEAEGVKEEGTEGNKEIVPHVIIGRDSRSSSKSLSEAAIEGVKALSPSIKVTDYGVVTTPMLHYFVVCVNTNGQYGEATVTGYFDKLVKAFHKAHSSPVVLSTSGRYVPRLYLDAANGVGAFAAKEFDKLLGSKLKIKIFNDEEGSDKLNLECGADYVKIHQKPPEGSPEKARKGERCVSIDGDADRIVYYYEEGDQFYLLDGDRIATLIANYFQELLGENNFGLQCGLVQTAYANGSSTAYIERVLRLPVFCVPTGVKHLHHKAKEEFDIGIYFEANGHGTVVFSDRAKLRLKEASTNKKISESSRESATKLLSIIDLVNETVGDALSDMLLVETILCAKGWDLTCWYHTYKSLCTKQIKVKVKDKNVFETTDAERKLAKPEAVQEVIDKLMWMFPRSRMFVRPSGTEDVVRVYAECTTANQTELLAGMVALAVYRLAGGIGPEPVIPPDSIPEGEREKKVPFGLF